MSNGIPLQAVAATQIAGGDIAAEPKVMAASVPQMQREAAASPVINPTLRLDPALGLVVIEFLNDTGAVTTSIPSERQLQAYQRWRTTQVGPTPAGEPHAAPERSSVT